MIILKVYSESPSEKQLRQISESLSNGGIMIWKADNRYSFACDALNAKAIERICSLKHLDPAKALLSIACPDISTASEYVRIDNRMFRLMKEHAPGPFTFIFKTGNSLPRAFKGRKTAGIRIPANGSALAILNHYGKPLLTSTLQDDDPDYTVNTGLIAEKYASGADMLVDCGDGALEETTVVDCRGDVPEIMRQGAGII